MVITSKLRRHKVMERAMRALMGNNLPPRFKFKDTYDSIEVPTTHQQHLPSQATLEAKFDELIAEEDVVAPTTQIKADMVVSSNLEVGTSNLFVDTQTGNIGIGTTNPARAFEIVRPGGGAIINLKRSDFGTGQGALAFVNAYSNVAASIGAARSGAEGGELVFYTAPNDTTQTTDNPYLIPERMRIDSSGNVGIGTASPDLELHVHDANNSTSGIILSSTSGYHRFYEASGQLYFQSGTAASADSRADINFTSMYASTTYMKILGSNGNVGIGTASPSSRFVSYGGALWDGSDHTSKVCATLQVGRGSGTGDPVQDQGTGAILEFRHHGDYRYVTMESVSEANYSTHIGLRFKTMDDGAAPEERMRIDAHGNVGIGTTGPARPLTVESSSFDGFRIKRTTAGGGSAMELINGDGDEWTVGVGGTGVFGIYTGATFGQQFSILANGYVGIGTASPQTKLNVRGSVSTGRNLAREVGTVISYSSQFTTARGAANVINGDKNFENGNNDWITASGQRANAYLVIDLGTAYAVDRLVIYNQNEYSNSMREVKGFKLQGSADNSTWTDVITSECGRSNAHEANPGWSFRIPQNWDDDTEGSSYRYWKFTMTSFHGTNSYGGIMELELYEATNALDDEVSTSSLVAEDVYGETGNFSRGVAIGKGYGGTSTGANRLLVEGNVGIGTTDPNRQLQIYGNSSNYFSFSPAEADDTSIVDNTNFGATSFKKQMMMRLNNRTWYWGIVNNSSNNLGLGADGGGGNDPDIQCVFQNNGTFFTKYLRVKENVGIGTTNPTHQLHIGPKDNDHIYLASSNNSYGWIIDTDDQGSGTVPFRIIKRTDGVDSTVLTIKNQDGNVGIGTTSPSHPLTIQETTTNTNTVTYPLAIRAISSGTVANGFGAGIRFQCERRDTNDYQSLAGSVEVYGAGNLPGTSDLWNMRFGVRNNDTAVTPMTLKYNGNVGIGTTSPGHILHVEGTSSTSPIYKGAGAAATSTFNYILNAPAPGTTSGGAVHFINGSTRSTDGGQSTYTIRNDSGALNLGNSNHATRILSNSFEYSNGDGSVTVYGPNTTWNSYLFVGAASDRNPNNNSDRAQVITTNGNLHLDAGGSRDIYMNYYSGNYIRHNGLGVYSDDRLKTDEELITNATETLLKLKPQRYTKAWTLNETELREPHTETGLIAQDIWYDAPELRHIVLLGEDANPSETKPSEPVPGDIQQDPDYSSWGPREAAVNYEGLIAYLIKSNQELYTEIQAEKARNDALEARIAALENA